jgi:hypothetical protein
MCREGQFGLIALQMAFGVFGPNPVSELLTAVVAWLPKAVVAIIIVVVAGAIAGGVKDLINNTLGGLSYGRLLGTIASVFILGLGVIAALNQIGVATAVTTPVLITVLATVGGILVVGVGGGLIRPMQNRWDGWLNRAEQEIPQDARRSRGYRAATGRPGAEPDGGQAREPCPGGRCRPERADHADSSDRSADAAVERISTHLTGFPSGHRGSHRTRRRNRLDRRVKTMAEHTPRVADAINTLVAAVRDRDIDVVSDLLAQWCRPASDDDLLAIVTALISAGGRKIMEPEAVRLPDAAFAVEVQNADGRPVDIDSIAPPVRAVLRAQLAWLNDRPEDVADQIRMVIDSGDSHDRMSMLVHALVWAVQVGVGESTEDGGSGR